VSFVKCFFQCNNNHKKYFFLLVAEKKRNSKEKKSKTIRWKEGKLLLHFLALNQKFLKLHKTGADTAKHLPGGVA
jgi:hypothetical protein